MILITGASGLIGGHLLVKLYKEKRKVRAFIRPTTRFEQLELICSFYKVDWLDVKSHIEWVYGDMLDEASLYSACENVAEIYHCAAVVSLDSTDAKALDEVNVRGTELICKAALAGRVKSFCMISSIAAIGAPLHAGDAADETCKKEEGSSGSDYSRSKYKSEEVVWEYIRKGLPAVIINPGVVLGPGLLNAGSMKIFETAMKGVPFYTSGGTGYVDVRDVVDCACLLTLRRVTGERYILVSENASYAQLFRLISDAVGVRRPFIPVGRPVLNVIGTISTFIQWVTRKPLKYTRSILLAAANRKYYSSAKITQEFGVRFIPLAETVKDIARFIKLSER
ncbi:MAG: NAD-dependent epimerase/dehydratase family protein [Bacteroidales bacterium]